MLADFRSADYLKINPLGQVPALVDGDVTVLESAAIMAYLVEKFDLPKHWIGGSSLVARTRVHEYLHWHHLHLRKGAAAFFKTYFAAEIENPDVDAELQVVEDSLKYVEAHFLDSRKFIGGDEISIADLQFATEIFQNQHGRLVHDLFDFPKSAAVVQAVRSLPNNAFNIVFKEQMDFNQSLPPVKSAQVTIRGNREVLKGLQKARPKRQNTFLIDKWVSQNFSSEQDQHDVVSQIHREQPN